MAYRFSLSHILRSRYFDFQKHCFCSVFSVVLLLICYTNCAFVRTPPPVLRLLSVFCCVLFHFGVAVLFIFILLAVLPVFSLRCCVFWLCFVVVFALCVVSVLALCFLPSVVCCVSVFHLLSDGLWVFS